MRTVHTQWIAQRWGRAIKDRRQQLGLSQQQLSALSGVLQQTISRVEKGSFIPTWELLLRICAGLGAEPGDLFVWPTLREVAS